MTPLEPLRWQRCSAEPFIPPQPGTLAPEAVTTPAVLIRGGETLLFVGAIDAGRERILVFPFDPRQLTTSQALAIPVSAQVALLAGPRAYDDRHVFDPAVVAVGERVHLYYSALGQGEDCIGLAISEDGRRFTKIGAPLLEGRSPEIVLHRERWHLYYVLKKPPRGYHIYCATSKDGLQFKPQGLAMGPGEAGAWDAYEVTTPRIFQRRGWYYMLYAGSPSPERKDLPCGFGLARSADLLRWEKYPANPVFETGAPGAWDDGAIWFGSVFAYGNVLYLLYEGGRLPAPSLPPPFTQVGLGRCEAEVFDEVLSEW